MKRAKGGGVKMLKVKPTVKGKQLKPVPIDKKKSLGKLPTAVRNKMGFMKDGGLLRKNNLKMDETKRQKFGKPLSEKNTIKGPKRMGPRRLTGKK